MCMLWTVSLANTANPGRVRVWWESWTGSPLREHGLMKTVVRYRAVRAQARRRDPSSNASGYRSHMERSRDTLPSSLSSFLRFGIRLHKARPFLYASLPRLMSTHHEAAHHYHDYVSTRLTSLSLHTRPRPARCLHRSGDPYPHSCFLGVRCSPSVAHRSSRRLGRGLLRAGASSSTWILSQPHPSILPPTV